jgi:hypothetical protein
MVFERKITRLFVAGVVFLSGSVCSLEVASSGPDIKGSNVMDVHAGTFDPVESNDAVWVQTKHTESAPRPEAISLAIPLNHTKGFLYSPAIKAHRPRAPPFIR